MELKKQIIAMGLSYLLLLALSLIDVLSVTASLIGAILFTAIFGIYITFARWERADKEKAERVKQEKEQLTRDFESDKKIFIRMPKGFVTIPLVIQKSNGWTLEQEKYTKGDLFFTIDDLQSMIK